MTVFLDADSIVFKLAMTQNTEHDMRKAWKRKLKDIGLQCWDQDLLVCIKGTSKNFRHKLYDQYKANRGELPKNVAEKVAYLYEHAHANGAIKARDNWEADDEVAEWVREAWHMGMDYTIAHIDKDLDMLPGKHYNYNRNEHYVLSVDDAYRDFYHQLFVGDSADNLPGVKGIGKVKANQLLDTNNSEHWDRLLGSLWNSEQPLSTIARCYWMGDPDNFTWDLRELYAQKESEEETDMESVPDLVGEEQSVLHRDDKQDGETT